MPDSQLDIETRAFLEAPLDGFTDYMADAIAEPLLELFFESDTFARFDDEAVLDHRCRQGHTIVVFPLVLWPSLAVSLLVNVHRVSPVHATPEDVAQLITHTIQDAPWFDGAVLDLVTQLAAFWGFLTTQFDRQNVREAHALLAQMAANAFDDRPRPDHCLQCANGGSHVVRAPRQVEIVVRPPFSGCMGRPKRRRKKVRRRLRKAR